MVLAAAVASTVIARCTENSEPRSQWREAIDVHIFASNVQNRSGHFTLIDKDRLPPEGIFTRSANRHGGLGFEIDDFRMQEKCILIGLRPCRAVERFTAQENPFPDADMVDTPGHFPRRNQGQRTRM